VAADFVSPLAEELAVRARDRFLRYVRVDTQSAYGSDTYPSTAKQLDLQRILEQELRDLGLEDVELTEHGYVFATVPPTAEGPTIALFGHVDTSPDESGANVSPQLIRYEGGDIVLPNDPSQVISPDESEDLANHVGHELVTTDGTTLLGADDKAGVAEIMAAVEYLLAHPELRRTKLRVAFTVDEEIGRGTDHVDLEQLGATYAYTLDGQTLGEIEDETFSASSVRITFRGREIHPGYAKGKLVNAIKLATELVSRLPKDGLSPETTEDHEGYVHPTSLGGTAAECTVGFIVRDFDTAKLDEHVQYLRALADEVAATEPRASVDFQTQRQYLNMKDYLAQAPHVARAAHEAARRAGVEPFEGFSRGGTDGSRLTEKGLPTPNIFTGMHEFHSRREWVCVHDMGAAAATLVHLAQVWAEDTP
jgi:tripeptide aminopeptidase